MSSKEISKAKNRRLDDAASNKIKVIIAQSARIVSLMFVSGTLIQTFLASLGISSELIYIHSSLLQAFSTATIILFSGFANKGCPIKRLAITAIPIGILFLVYVPLAISRSASLLSYLLLVGVGVAQQIAIGLATVCEYKVPYYIYRVEEYGVMNAVCGIISSVLSLGIGALISRLSTVYDFVDIMTVSFIVCAVLMLINCVFTMALRNLRGDEDKSEGGEDKKASGSVLSLLKYPVFYHLIPANLLRGFTAGVISVLATVALELGYNETLTSTMVSVSAAATMVGCLLFAAISKKVHPTLPIIAGSLLIVTMPLLLINNSAVFLAVYGIILLGRTFVDYGVPTMLIRIVPVEISGSYNAWRMVLNHLGGLIGTTVAAWLPIPVLLTLAIVSQAASGVSYLLSGKKMMSK